MLRNAKRSPLPPGLPSQQTTSSGCPRDLRNAKVQELKRRCPGLQECAYDTEYRLSFRCSGTDYQLIITLPQEFPFAGPVLTVRPAARHPLLDDTSTVCGLADLTAFSIHASLPDIVHQVLSDFIKIPLCKRHDGAAVAAGSSWSGPAGGSAASATIAKAMFMNGSLSAGPPPFVSSGGAGGALAGGSGGGALRAASIYSEVNALSVEDLREWMTDELKIKDFVEAMPHVRARTETLRLLAETNEAIAKENLAKKESLEEHRGQVVSRCEELSKARSEFEAQQETFGLLVKGYAPETLKESLVRRAQEAEEQSETIAQQFLNKEVAVEVFLRSFTDTRARSHERSAKAERLHLQLEALHRAGF